MTERIESLDWKHLLQYQGTSPVKLGHESTKNRILTFIERTILRGRQPWGYRNGKIVRGV